MQKLTKAITAMMLMVAVVCSTGCHKDPNNNGGNGGDNDGDSSPTTEGTYLGIIGFNEVLYQKYISLLDSSTKASFNNFISGLSMADGTALYYADYTALNELQSYPEPPALKKVALVTFTDGLDNLSTSGSTMNPEGYESIAAYRTALHNKILNDKVHGKSITAYTIGLRGNDVQNNLTEFRTNLNMLASDANNVFEVIDMNEALDRFKAIAEDLYHSVTTVNLRFKLPGGLDDGLVIRFTFDNITDGGSSEKYIQCSYKRTENNGRRLENIDYHGFTAGVSSMDPVFQTVTGTFHWFEFAGLTHPNGNAISQYDINRLQLWKKQGSIWQRDSEFAPGSSSEVTETKSSALIMLVLDCTSSLNNDFINMKTAATQFMEALCSSNANGGSSGSDYTPEVTTSNITDISDTSAKCGGTAVNNGGPDIIVRGVCWSTDANPTINDSKTNDGSDSGSFTSNITGLNPGSTYYVRAYATNALGTGYGEQKTFTTNSVMPTVTTASVTSISQTTATCGGNVTEDGGNSVAARGVCWSMSQNPTINDSHTTDGTGTGIFTSSITGLEAGKTYYIRAYATNSVGTSYGIQKSFRTVSVEGAIGGVFSVGPSTCVFFSKGNLQYQARSNTWSFAENQYDCIGNSNSNITSGYSGWIDLFGWGTSGWDSGANCYQPWSTSSSNYSYHIGGSYTNNLFGNYANADWGVYNAISNGGNQAGLWRTLIHAEWDYVFNTRSTPSGIRYAKACVNNVNGIILLPDDWNSSYYSLSNTNTTSENYSHNTITLSQWNLLEQHGAVFLPAAGYREVTTVSGVGQYGHYWSAKSGNIHNAFSVYFNGVELYADYESDRHYGFSVRLVCPIQ